MKLSLRLLYTGRGNLQALYCPGDEQRGKVVHHPDPGLPWPGQYLPYKQALHPGLQLALESKKSAAERAAAERNSDTDHAIWPHELEKL